MAKLLYVCQQTDKTPTYFPEHKMPIVKHVGGSFMLWGGVSLFHMQTVYVEHCS